MMECPRCGRAYPEVAGADSQVCPHCGHEVDAPPAQAPLAKRNARADPVGALEMAWRVGRREYPRLLLLWIPALAVELAAAFLVDAYGRGVGIPADAAEMRTGQMMQWLGVAAPLYLLVFTTRLALWTFVAARTLDVALGGSRLSRWRALLGPALAMGFVLTLAYAAGWMMLVVGFLVFYHWFLYAPAELADGAGGVAVACDRSRRFARERSTAGFTALALLVGALLLVPYFVLGALPGALGLALAPLWGWLAGPIVPLLAASFVAVARERPPPGATRIVARSSTRCPRCGTLIPYTPSGSAVDVVCPSCGRSGKVL